MRTNEGQEVTTQTRSHKSHLVNAAVTGT
jgi:hypothetical protein